MSSEKKSHLTGLVRQFMSQSFGSTEIKCQPASVMLGTFWAVDTYLLGTWLRQTHSLGRVTSGWVMCCPSALSNCCPQSSYCPQSFSTARTSPFSLHKMALRLTNKTKQKKQSLTPKENPFLNFISNYAWRLYGAKSLIVYDHFNPVEYFSMHSILGM